jgi:hypothetical protein
MTSPRIRLSLLLDNGFYPSELPPPFKTNRFSLVHNTLSPRSDYRGSTTFFDGATFRGTLRTFGVINPINFFNLSKFIAENWSSISNIYKVSRCSGARPKFPRKMKSGRAIEIASLTTQRRSKAHLASAFPIIANLDINRFYGSIYTHSIPWAVLGKEQAKNMFASRTLAGHWSDKLDTLVRNCNQAQTVGIPIGPDTSRIISELILSRIDSELTAVGSKLRSTQVFHSIDDYQIGVFSVSERENAQTEFIRAIGRYEHRLNDSKSSINFGLKSTPLNFQRHFDILTFQTGGDFVEHFFEILYEQIPKYSQVNVLGYALKRFDKKLARNPQIELVREHLQRLIYSEPHQARWLLPILLSIYKAKGTNAEIKTLVSWGVEVCARRNDVGSVLWFLYAAIFLKINLSVSTCSQCINMANELVDVMLFHGKDLGLFQFRVSVLRARYSTNDFKTSAWLPLYEIERRRWDTSASFTKIGTASDPGNHYATLQACGVEFYRTENEYFEVKALEGWNLEVDDFDADWDLDFKDLEVDEPYV